MSLIVTYSAHHIRTIPNRANKIADRANLVFKGAKGLLLDLMKGQAMTETHMTDTNRYRVDQLLRMSCGILQISTDAVLRRARLPASCLSAESKGVSAEDYMALWRAMEATYGKPDMAERLGIAAARGPFVPSFFAFSCSSDIRTGLQRLALFKPLVGPLQVLTEETADHFTLHLRPVRRDLAMPASMAHSEMVMFLELFRIQIADHIVPRAVTLPTPGETGAAFFGVEPRNAPYPSLTISASDARRPFVGENPEMWAMFEPQLQKQLAERIASASIRDRLRNALLEAIPAGEVTSDQLAARLGLSKRSLQRYLQEDGTSFQDMLDQTRADLAQHYLSHAGTSLDEIAYLLGYNTPASFFRAFQKWFGMTPTQFKKTAAA